MVTAAAVTLVTTPGIYVICKPDGVLQWLTSLDTAAIELALDVLICNSFLRELLRSVLNHCSFEVFDGGYLNIQ